MEKKRFTIVLPERESVLFRSKVIPLSKKFKRSQIYKNKAGELFEMPIIFSEIEVVKMETTQNDRLRIVFDAIAEVEELSPISEI